MTKSAGCCNAISYPRDHFFIYDLKTRQRRDLGRIGSINSQTVFLDRRHRVWTTNDYGHLVRYTPDTDRLEISPDTLPPCQLSDRLAQRVLRCRARSRPRMRLRLNVVSQSAPDAHLAE